MKKIERNTNNDSSIRRYNYIPLIIIIIYLVLTYTIHLLKAESPSISGLLFISITDIAIVIGYLLPAQKRIHSGVNDWRFNRNIEKLIVICMIFTIINSLNNISSFYYGVENLFDFVTNPGKAYEYVKFLRNHPEYNLTGIRFGSTVGILLTLFSGTKYIYLLLSFLYWKQLKNKIKLFFFITTAVYVIQSLLLGAMITIAALFFSCMPIIIKSLLTDKYKWRNKSRILFFGKRRRRTIVLIIATFVFVTFFIGNRIDESSSLIAGINSLTNYMSHGYYGFEKCLELPFECTFGFTTFYGITSYFTQYLGVPDFFQNSYLVRNEIATGWPALSVWSTIYPWLASDFTFYLVPFILGFISYEFGLIWNKTIRTENPYGYLLLGQFFIFWFMIPANNQLFHTLGNAASFLLILCLYITSKIKFMKKIRLKV